MLKGNAIVGQSGGPTAAINATLAGVIRGAIQAECIETVYGMRNGIEGLLEERVVDLGKLFGSEDELKILEQTPAAALGSCRKKLPKPDSEDEADKELYRRLFKILEGLNIRYFFYIGGNDSMDTVAKLSAYAEKAGVEMRIVGVPKTIDNDLALTDHTPGFGSAAKYIATTMSEIIRDCSVYNVKAVTIVEIMGRDAGWLTAAAALPRVITGIEPDYVYLPEAPFSMEGFYKDIEAAFERHPNIVIAVSEGARFADGRYVGEGTQSGATDVFGHKYLEGTGKALENAVKEHFGCKVRSIELNLPQRCAAHLTSATDLSESQNCGLTAVNSAVSGVSGHMIAMVRAEGDEYKITYEPKDVTKIANAVRDVPREFINEAGNNVTDECLNYIKPLIEGETKLFFKNGLPVHFIIK